jgi:hypothetical protein
LLRRWERTGWAYAAVNKRCTDSAAEQRVVT